jgi:hypothetical protein
MSTTWRVSIPTCKWRAPSVYIPTYKVVPVVLPWEFWIFSSKLWSILIQGLGRQEGNELLQKLGGIVLFPFVLVTCFQKYTNKDVGTNIVCTQCTQSNYRNHYIALDHKVPSKPYNNANLTKKCLPDLPLSRNYPCQKMFTMARVNKK